MESSPKPPSIYSKSLPASSIGSLPSEPSRTRLKIKSYDFDDIGESEDIEFVHTCISSEDKFCKILELYWLIFTDCSLPTI